MKHNVDTQQIHSARSYKLKRPLVTACGGLALMLAVAACGPQGQDQQGEKPAAQQSEQTGQKPKKMQQPAAKPNHGMAGGAEQGATMGNQPPARGAQPLGAAAGGESMSSQQPSPQFQALDTNHDGQITPAEASSNPQLSKMFKSLDDGDGQLDNAEFSAFKKKKGDGPTAGGAQPSATEENPNRPK